MANEMPHEDNPDAVSTSEEMEDLEDVVVSQVIDIEERVTSVGDNDGGETDDMADDHDHEDDWYDMGDEDLDEEEAEGGQQQGGQAMLAAEAARQKRRELILGINRRTDVNCAMKQKMIQTVLSQGTSHGTKVTTAEDDKVSAMVPCEHYPSKKCGALFFTCCGTYDACSRCHREIRECPRGIQSPWVESICCVECETRQPVSATCVNESCGVRFGTTHCEKCILWSELDIYHCEKCTICRVGSQELHKHCDTCQTCMRKEHNCDNDGKGYAGFRESRCGFCFKDCYASMERSSPMWCGHFCHTSCLEKLNRPDGKFLWHEWRCPLCRKSLLGPGPMKRVWRHTATFLAREHMPPPGLLMGGGDAFYNTLYGAFRFKSGSSGPLFDNTSMVHGELIDMVLRDGTCAKITLRRVDVKYGAKVKCIDCDARSNGVPFHFGGVQCPKCESFNTAIDAKSPWADTT